MIASFHGNEEMQVVGEMMMRHTERVYQLTDWGHIGYEENGPSTEPCGTPESQEEC